MTVMKNIVAKKQNPSKPWRLLKMTKSRAEKKISIIG